MEKLELAISLKKIKKEAILAQTTNAYVLGILDCFLSDNKAFLAVCDNFGLTDDELLTVLKSPNITQISLLDEIAQFLESRQLEATTEIVAKH